MLFLICYSTAMGVIVVNVVRICRYLVKSIKTSFTENPPGVKQCIPYTWIICADIHMHLELNLQSAWALKYSILQTYYNAIVELWLGQYSVDRTFQSHL